MGDKLTELDGIGEKTAEDLRAEGIDSPDELGQAFLSQDPAVTDSGKRVNRAARDALFESEGSFTDPASGAEITEDKRFAFEKLGTRTVGESQSVSSRGTEGLDADTEFRELVAPVRRGEFYDEVGDNPGALELAANTAGNITDDELSTGELIDLNRAAKTREEELTLRKRKENRTKTTAQGKVQAGGLVRALAAHNRRSMRAQQVDRRRKAERTTDFETWRSAPDSYDYPGVDTKIGLGRLFPEERTKRKRTFGSTTLRNRDRDELESAAEELNQLDAEQTRRLFGEAERINVDIESELERE